MTTLTPFEKLAAHREKMAFQSAAIKALMDLVERAEESQLQVDYYKELLKTGTREEREEERGVTVEAMKDLRALNEAIALICENLKIEA